MRGYTFTAIAATQPVNSCGPNAGAGSVSHAKSMRAELSEQAGGVPDSAEEKVDDDEEEEKADEEAVDDDEEEEGECEENVDDDEEEEEADEEAVDDEDDEEEVVEEEDAGEEEDGATIEDDAGAAGAGLEIADDGTRVGADVGTVRCDEEDVIGVEESALWCCFLFAPLSVVKIIKSSGFTMCPSQCMPPHNVQCPHCLNGAEKV